ncbi:MAG: type II secretion system F family protein [Gemmatimonadota bacterium]|nr:type II secretion system F family protein [Gemmatimonadota bacterium]
MMTYLVAALVTTSIVSLVYGLFALVPARSRAITRRLDELQSGAVRHYAIERRRRQEKRERLEGLLEAFGEKIAKQRADWSDVERQLVQAGYRRSSAVAVYYAVVALFVVGLGGVGFFAANVASGRPGVILFATAVGAITGWVIPRFAVKRRIRTRQKEIQKALADALDLLVVCVEAGLGLNQALVRVSDEIEHVSTTMSEELMLTNFEIRAGTPRDEALRNLGDRTGVEDLKALTAMLVQTDRFGTSIATALRVHSDTLRTKRRQRAEEAAAKTTIKLVFPLVLFIFPAMFVVILGPAIIHILAQMEGLVS